MTASPEDDAPSGVSRRGLMLGGGALALFASLGIQMVNPSAANAAGTMYNPWAGKALSTGGTWADHLGRTDPDRGGIDYPFGIGTVLRAPAAGHLRTSGGVGDTAAGNIGGAGLRSILELGASVPRQKPAETSEGSGNLVAVVLQHQSEFMPEGQYAAGDIIGFSGNTGNVDPHLHVHGLNAAGLRLNFLNFITATTPPTETLVEIEDDMRIVIQYTVGPPQNWDGYLVTSRGVSAILTALQLAALRKIGLPESEVEVSGIEMNRIRTALATIDTPA